jgi:hypothetical protein
MDALAAALLAPSTSPDGLTYGVVTSTAPFLVRVGAAVTPYACRRLASYTPAIADLVAQGADRLVLGKVTT